MKLHDIDWGEVFDYCPSTGLLFWRIDRPGKNANVGDVAGSPKTGDGRYWVIHYQQKKYYAHRIAWEIANGPIPKGMVIDHIDGDGTNNRLDNMRVVTRSQNQRNKALQKNSPFGISGIRRYRKSVFMVYSFVDRNIGRTDDFFEACCLRKSWEVRNGFHENHGRAR